MKPQSAAAAGILVLLALIGVGVLAFGGSSDAATTGATPAPADGEVPGAIPDHQRFTQILSEVVQMPNVDYARLQEERQALDGYIDQLSRTDPGTLESAPREDQLAFWINAYNACMLRLVIDHYPIEPGGVGLFGGIRNRVAGYPDNSVWQIRDVFSRDHCPVAGADRSQDEIEHEIIRPRFDEPRIHFAVNCAARSCPVLWPEAYRGDELESQLDRAVEYLMDQRDHFRLEPGPPPVLTLNKVLDWYAEDFDGTPGLKRFFQPYLDESQAELLRRDDARVEFFEYDWTLNDIPR